MKQHSELAALMKSARAERRCITAPNVRLAEALRRRRRAGELLSPYPALFAEAEVWNHLASDERSRWIVTALAKIHPQWVFTGLSAASIFRLWLCNALESHKSVQIASPTVIHGERRNAHLHHFHIPTMRIIDNNGIPTTNIVQTLLSCGTHYAFTNALPLFDSALRFGLTSKSDLRQEALAWQPGKQQNALLKLIKLSNPLSENGGESLCRATMLTLGFPAPRLQVQYPNPANPDWPLRVDFEFTAIDGGIVAVEFDGEQKYIDPKMTKGNSISATVYEERERQNYLLRCGISRFVRINFREMMNQRVLAHKLLAAGIPLANVPETLR